MDINNNTAIADELDNIALELSTISADDIKTSLSATERALSSVDEIAQKMEVPSLRALAHWMTLNLELNNENQAEIETLLRENSYSEWIEILAAILHTQDQSLFPKIYDCLTKPNWIIKPSALLLKDFATWIESSNAEESDASKEVENKTTDENLSKEASEETYDDHSTTGTDFVHVPVFEEVDIEILEKPYETTASKVLKELNIKPDLESGLVQTEKTSSYFEELRSTENQEEVFLDPVKINDDILQKDFVVDVIPPDELDQRKTDELDQRKTEDTDLLLNDHDKFEQFNDFSLEIDDIVMSLMNISSTSKDVFTDSDKLISELKRLNMLAEINDYPNIIKISDWCQRNIVLFTEEHSDEGKQFITSGECWSWLELIHACLCEPEEISHLSALSAELNRGEWIEPIPIDDLENLLLFIREPHFQTANTSSNKEANIEEDRNQEAGKTKTEESESPPSSSKFTLCWNDDIHPELLSAFFQETPEHISELAKLLEEISIGNSSKEDQQHATRLAHTIKGGSAVVGITALSEFSHKLEDILDFSVEHPLPTEISEFLPKSAKCLITLFDAVQNQKSEPEDFAPTLKKLSSHAETLLNDKEEALEKQEEQILDLELSDLPDFITSNLTTNDKLESISDDPKEADSEEKCQADLIEPQDASNQVEDIDNFSAEIDDITMSLFSIESKPENVFEQKDQYIAELQRLELLSEMLQYTEISKASQWCQQNLKLFADKPTDKARQFIVSGEIWSWIELISATLAEPEEASLLSSLNSELMRSEWLEPFPMDQLPALLLQLKTGLNEGSAKETFEQEKPDESTENREDLELHDSTELKLSWDNDVHPELLETYFQETPDQVAEVAELLQKISKNKANKDEQKHAARIAHTIKGASGVVGINGLVEYTHKLEDILDYSVNHDLPDETAELLAESADCLEDLFEAIQNQQPAPKEFAPILDKLTRYASLLENDDFDETLLSPNADALPDFIAKSSENKGVTEKVQEPDFSSLMDNSASPDTKAETETEASDKKGTNTETHIRVPIAIIDKLLNLAGELVTISSQVSDKIENTLLTSKQIKTQDNRVHKMLEELTTTISKQEKDQYTMLSNLKKSDFDNLEMDTYNELHSITGLLTESILDSEEIESHLSQQIFDLNEHLRSLDQLNKELSDVILSSRMVSLNKLVPRLERIVRQTCRKTGKKAELMVSGNDINVDTDILNGLTDPLLHLLRNAIDHGIETPQDRKTKGKAETGKITLDFSRHGNHIHMQLKDDGAGIDSEKVYQRAIENGLITPDEEYTKDEILKLILQAGFTTQDGVTDISGRGVGMDVVKNSVDQLGGTLEINSEVGEGTTFTLKIPLTLVTSATLLVSVSGNQIAIPSDSIEQLFYLSPDLVLDQDKTPSILYNGKELPIQSLASLLGWQAQPIDFSIANTLLLIKGENQIHALYIDEIIHSREVVIKSLSSWIDSSKGLIGACHLSDGGVAPVINLPQLIKINEKADKTLSTVQTASSESLPSKAIPRVLVVDDSLSNRKALSLIIEQTDYEVLTAVDGLDALNVMNEQPIDLVFTDLEMPRMNGLELTQAIRVWDDKKETPVVMITSRTTSKHRQLAEKAGVDDYLTKPVVTETLLNSLNKWLKQPALED